VCIGVVSESSSKVAQAWKFIGVDILSGLPSLPVFPAPSASSQPVFCLHSHDCRSASHAHQPSASAHHTRTCSADCRDWSRGDYDTRQSWQSWNTENRSIKYSVIRYFCLHIYTAALNSVISRQLCIKCSLTEKPRDRLGVLPVGAVVARSKASVQVFWAYVCQSQLINIGN